MQRLVGFILPENPAMIDAFSVRLRMMDLLSACNLIDEGEKASSPLQTLSQQQY